MWPGLVFCCAGGRVRQPCFRRPEFCRALPFAERSSTASTHSSFAVRLVLSRFSLCFVRRTSLEKLRHLGCCDSSADDGITCEVDHAANGVRSYFDGRLELVDRRSVDGLVYDRGRLRDGSRVSGFARKKVWLLQQTAVNPRTRTDGSTVTQEDRRLGGTDKTPRTHKLRC